MASNEAYMYTSNTDNTVPLHGKTSSGKKKLYLIVLAAFLVVAAAVVAPVVIVTRKHKNKKNPTAPGGGGETFTPDLSLPSDTTCKILEATAPNNGSGPLGTTNVTKTMVLKGLEVPWQMAYEPGSTLMFLTERVGRLSQFVAGTEDPSLKLLALVPDVAGPDYTQEGGLLGLAIDFSAETANIYIYVTSGEGGLYRNRVERWTYDKASQTVAKDKVILDNIPSSGQNNGGFLKLRGGFLYISTGDALKPSMAQDKSSLSGKILRINPDGTFPADNPFPHSPVFIYGLRNPAGFDFLDDNTLVIVDHGVGGVAQGGDRVVVGTKGANLGWGKTFNCQTNKAGEETIVAPRLVFGVINPPGGVLVYNPPSNQESDVTIPAWKGHLLVTSLRGRNLQDITLSPGPANSYVENQVYFMKEAGMGRLRIILLNDRNVLYIGTSNCDARGKDLGACKNTTMDAIYRISPPQ